MLVMGLASDAHATSTNDEAAVTLAVTGGKSISSRSYGYRVDTTNGTRTVRRSATGALRIEGKPATRITPTTYGYLVERSGSPPERLYKTTAGYSAH